MSFRQGRRIRFCPFETPPRRFVTRLPPKFAFFATYAMLVYIYGRIPQDWFLRAENAGPCGETVLGRVTESPPGGYIEFYLYDVYKYSDLQPRVSYVRAGSAERENPHGLVRTRLGHSRFTKAHSPQLWAFPSDGFGDDSGKKKPSVAKKPSTRVHG